MEKKIIEVLKWKGYIPSDDNPDELTNYSYRIKTSDGSVYCSYRLENEPELIINQTYRMRETGEMEFSFQNEPKRMYKKVKIYEMVQPKANPQLTIESLLEPTQIIHGGSPTPTQMVQMSSDVEYHKMALEYLWRSDMMNLPNLAKLAPVMKQICEGKMDENKLGKLNLEFYGTMV